MYALTEQAAILKKKTKKNKSVGTQKTPHVTCITPENLLWTDQYFFLNAKNQ